MGARHMFLAMVLSVPLLAGTASADDADDLRDAKIRVADFDRNSGKAKDDMAYSNMVMELVQVPHVLCVDRVARILFTDKDKDHQLMAAGALSECTRNETVKLAAGRHLTKALDEIKDLDVLQFCVDGLGKLRHRDAIPKLTELLKKGGDPWVLVECVETCGEINDRRCLPALLMLWERFPVGDSWEGGEVTVDTGAAGDADQKAAEAKYQAEHGNSGRRGKPPMMLRVYIQKLANAVRIITGDETIKKPQDLRLWMEARSEELRKEGIDVPKKVGRTPEKDDKKGKKDKKDGDGGDEGGGKDDGDAGGKDDK